MITWKILKNFSLGTLPDCAKQVKEKQSSDFLKERILHFRHYKKRISNMKI